MIYFVFLTVVSLLCLDEPQPRRVLNDAHSRYGILTVISSDDGKLLASAGVDGTIRLWDAESLRAIGTIKTLPNVRGLTLPGHMRGIAFVGGKSSMIASISSGTEIVLWDTRNFRRVDSIATDSPPVCLRSIPGRPMLITTNGENGATIWDVMTKKKLGEIGSPKDRMNIITVSANGDMLAGGDMDNGLTVWQIKERKQLLSLADHKDMVSSIAFSSDGKLLASGDFSGKVIVWNLADGRPKFSINGGTGRIRTLFFAKSDTCLAWAAVDDGKLLIWDIPNDMWKSSLSDKDILGITLCPRGKSLLSWGSRSSIIEWGDILD